jgi:hypothetical protein
MTDGSDTIRFWDVPERNERVYSHDCEYGHRWVVPLDDCPRPRENECPECLRVLPVVDAPTYAALHIPAFTGGSPIVGGEAVLLAVQKNADPELRKVIALSENEARHLHASARLTGWQPNEDAR